MTWSELGGCTNLDLLLAKRNFANNLQTRGLVWFRVDQVLGLQNVFVLLTVGWRSAPWVAELVGSWRNRSSSVVHVSTSQRASARLQRWDGMLSWELQTYEVRLRFWRASGLLSTSGGILFATVSGECTRNAKSVVAVAGLVPKSRLPMRSEGATGSGEEGDISNNGSDKRQAESEWFKDQWALDLEQSNRETIWWQGMLDALVRRARCAAGPRCKTSTALSLLGNIEVQAPLKPHSLIRNKV